ncbi:MAG: hypothetical protein GF331_21540 [Chitinivibrionales bacterium]|nr:hypothetical protein [Chitinivibrionales bacterium]
MIRQKRQAVACVPMLTVLMAMLSCGAQVFAAKAPVVQLVASGESHAMLYPCDCPDAPGGGFAERASAIAHLRDAGPMVLVDGGGFAGGGIYDTYTEGRRADSLRTLAALEAMGRMGYDGVAVGDDDLQYGAQWLADAAERAGVPLVCANCSGPDGKQLFAPYRIVHKDGVRVGITAVTTPERLFAVDTQVTVHDPLPALRAAVGELRPRCDVVVVLSHLGQQATAALAGTFPSAIFVNAHRKRDPGPLVAVGDRTLLQFGFQGKQLVRATVTLDSSGARVRDAAWEPIDQAWSPDTSVRRILDTHATGTAAAPYDLYIMSQCPYGIDALAHFVDYVRAMPSAEWGIWFIGTVDENGRLESLHGSEEIEDEKLWLAVAELYPEHYLAFLASRAAGAPSAEAAAASVGLDISRLRTWAQRHGQERLALQYRRSMRLGIRASPTLTRGNLPLDIEPTLPRLLRDGCRHVDSSAPVCDSLPECFDDSDCRRPGKVGTCTGDGGARRCEYQDAVAFTFTVVAAEGDSDRSIDAAVQTTRELFPGVTVERLSYESRKGRKLVERFGPPALPLYLFERDVRNAHNYAKVEPGLVERDGYLTFRDGIMPRTYFHQRAHRPAEAVLFVDPLLPVIGDILHTIGSAAQKVRILPVILADPDSGAADSEDRLRLEEAQRWLLLDSLYNDAFPTYLQEYAKRPGSSYWFRALGAAGVDLDAFMGHIEADTQSLARGWRLVHELGIRTPVALLLDNRRLVRVDDPRTLGALLQAERAGG